MKVLDPGHKFELEHLDGTGKEVLTFVKREGKKFPGNTGHYEGTNLQEVLRACISRLRYLNNQIPSTYNGFCIRDLQSCLAHLEERAAVRHGRQLRFTAEEWNNIEYLSVCSECGHIKHHCEDE